MVFSIDWAFVWQTFKPYGYFVLGMLLYAFFVYAFYERVSRRLIFDFQRKDYKYSKHPGLLQFWTGFTYLLKYIFLAPLFMVFWFAVLAVLLMLMSKNMTIAEGLLLGMSMLTTIRISAYFNSKLAEDLAKILPLALLAYFLVNRTDIDLPLFLSKMSMLPDRIPLLLTYFAFAVLLEFILRLYDAAANRE